MKELITNNFIIEYQDGLESFIKDSLNIFDLNFPLIKETFNCNIKEIGKLKAYFFTQRNDFVEYIKFVSDGYTPPSWVTGCFYNGEIQTLVEVDSKKIYTLTHEMVHLYIQKLIYDKYNIDRIRWFDESYASYLDGHIKNKTLNELKSICLKLKSLHDFDVNILDNVENIKTNSYNGYDIFLIVGKYIFENKLAKKYIEIIKTDFKKIREIGSTILTKSIKFIEKL